MGLSPLRQSASLLAGRAASKCNQKDRALPPRMRRKETDHIVVVERQPAAAQLLRVGSKVKFSAENPGLELHRPVSPVSVALKNLLQVGEEEHIHRSVSRNVLLQPEISSFVAELSRF